jgi:hypothetical protein
MQSAWAEKTRTSGCAANVATSQIERADFQHRRLAEDAEQNSNSRGAVADESLIDALASLHPAAGSDDGLVRIKAGGEKLIELDETVSVLDVAESPDIGVLNSRRELVAGEHVGHSGRRVQRLPSLPNVDADQQIEREERKTTNVAEVLSGSVLRVVDLESLTTNVPPRVGGVRLLGLEKCPVPMPTHGARFCHKRGRRASPPASSNGKRAISCARLGTHAPIDPRAYVRNGATFATCAG